jgi:hypothetical protein
MLQPIAEGGGGDILSCCSFCFCAATKLSRNSCCLLLKLAALSGVMSAMVGARDGPCAAAAALNNRARVARACDAGMLWRARTHVRRASMVAVSVRW